MVIKLRKTWSNRIGKHKVRPLRYYLAQSLGDLKRAVKEAERIGVRLRAVGSGHSFNDVACSNGYLVDISQLNKPLELPAYLKPEHRERNLVHIEAGIVIQDLNKVLWKMGYAMKNLGAIDEQTLAGAISTGTHGSGIGIPAISGFVESIVLVATGGKAYRIEPTNGISDPATFDEKTMTLVQNDDDFYSVLVSLGSTGVVYSYILRVEPRYWIEENRTLEQWSEVKKKLRDKSLFEPHLRSASLYVNPYPNKQGDHDCIVLRMKEVQLPANRSRFELMMYSMRTYTRRPWTFWGNTLLSYWILSFVLRYFSNKMHLVINQATRALKGDQYINRSYKVLHQGAEFIKTKAYDTEMAFDIDSDYPVVLDEILTKSAKMREHGHYQTSPIGMRFVAASKAYLTPESERTVCYIDTPVLKGTIGGDEILEQYQEIMLRNGGRPHWGKMNAKLSAHVDALPERYPMLPVWKAVMNKYNALGTFSNHYTDRFQLTEKSKTAVQV